MKLVKESIGRRRVIVQAARRWLLTAEVWFQFLMTSAEIRCGQSGQSGQSGAERGPLCALSGLPLLTIRPGDPTWRPE
jgi:hypothetical protein